VRKPHQSNDWNIPLPHRVVIVRVKMIVTFLVSRRRREMYCGHARLCVCLSVWLCVCLSAAACPHYCTDPDVTWGSGRGCPQVVHYWADLQSVHGLRCYGNIARTRNASKYMLVLALCLVIVVFNLYTYRHWCVPKIMQTGSGTLKTRSQS